MNSGQGDENFLASWKQLDNHIKNTKNSLSFVRSLQKDSDKKNKDIKICLDEWNVWNFQDIKFDSMDDLKGMTTFVVTDAKKWEEHPGILQEKYSLLDALTVGGLGIDILNNVDQVGIACLAQLINDIAPITTDEEGNLLKQTIYYPFELLSKYGRGIVLQPAIHGDQKNTSEGEVPAVEAAAVYDEDAHEIHVFALNSSLSSESHLELNLNGFNKPTVTAHIVFTGDDLSERNTFDHPDNILPAEGDTSQSVDDLTLPQASWNVYTIHVD